MSAARLTARRMPICVPQRHFKPESADLISPSDGFLLSRRKAAAVINHPLEAPGLLWSNVSDRIQEMDAEGIDIEALSINPFWYRAERDAAAELIKIQNEKLAEFCAATPDRFVAFDHVPVAESEVQCRQLHVGGVGARDQPLRRDESAVHSQSFHVGVLRISDLQ